MHTRAYRCPHTHRHIHTTRKEKIMSTHSVLNAREKDRERGEEREREQEAARAQQRKNNDQHEILPKYMCLECAVHPGIYSIDDCNAWKKNCTCYQRSDRIEIFNPLTTALQRKYHFTYVHILFEVEKNHTERKFHNFQRFIFKTGNLFMNNVAEKYHF